MKARVSVILSLVAFCTLPSAAQKVKLSKALSGVIDTAWMPVTRHANIFEKHAWLQPDIKSIPFSMTDGEAQLEVGGNVLTVSGGRDGLSISVAGESRTAAPRTCTNCYPDKSVLRMKAVVTSMWVPVTTYVMQSHMVARSRPVTRYQYNASTRTTQAVHSTETYYTTEFRHVPRTTYRYQSRTTYVLDIPKSTVFEFGGLVQPTDQYLVYAPNDDSDLWHLQQTSFLIATSSDGIHYVMIDSDADGDFTGKRDQVAFNTWNPYDEGSRYRAMRRFSSNRWYSHEELAQESFIELDLSDDGQRAIGRDLNHGYYGKKEFGTLSIVGLPQDGEVVINGERFPARKLSKPLRCQFGYYNVHLKRPGHLEQNSVVHVHASGRDFELRYDEAPQAALIRVTNIFSQDFTVQVSSSSGYRATHYNTVEFTAPKGAVKVSIDNDGYAWEGEYDLSSSEDLVVDYEAEIQKSLTPSAKEGEEENEKE